MAKNWVKVETVNDAPNIETYVEKKRKFSDFNKMIRNTKTKKAHEIMKENEELYEQKVANEDALLAAFEDKKLKSKTLIKQALRIKKERTEAAEKAAKDAKQKSKTTSDNKNEVTE